MVDPVASSSSPPGPLSQEQERGSIVALKPSEIKPRLIVSEEREELAQVVVAAAVAPQGGRSWARLMRPWLFCLAFLLIAELGARFAFDRSLCLRHERFDNFPSAAAEDVWIDQIRRDPAYRVVMIGDSVVVGASLLNKDETIPRYLEEELNRAHRGREVHVWNLSLAGSRSADQLCLLQKALEAKPDLVVLSGNYIMFGTDIRGYPLANPWLARNLPAIPPEIAPIMPARDYKEAVDDTVTQWFEKNSRLVGMRQAINGLLFGVQPRAPYKDPNPAVMAGVQAMKRAGKLRMQAWNERGALPSGAAWMYSQPIRPDNLNARFIPPIYEALRRTHTPAITYLTPQNPFFIASYMKPAEYARNVAAIDGFFNNPAVPHYDFSTLLPTNLFYDNDHLLAEGNRQLAQSLAAKLLPIVSGH